MLQKQENSLQLKQTEQYELSSVTNMPDKSDIDVLEVFKNSRTNEIEYRQKNLKQPVSNLPVLERKSAFRLTHF